MAANKRTLLDNYSRERGSIIVGGQADREVRAGRRPVPPACAPIPRAALLPGHRASTPTRWAAPYGLEHASDDLLSGDSDTPLRPPGHRPAHRAPHGRRDARADHRPQGAEGGRSTPSASSKGAVVALDPRTGAILAMVSHPQYDPNPISSHDLTKAASGLEEAVERPGQALPQPDASTETSTRPARPSRSSRPPLPSSRGCSSDENSEVPGPAVLDLPLTERDPAQRERSRLRAQRQDDAHPRPRDLVQHRVRLARPRAGWRAAARAGREVRLRRLAHRSPCASRRARCRPTSTRPRRRSRPSGSTR